MDDRRDTVTAGAFGMDSGSETGLVSIVGITTLLKTVARQLPYLFLLKNNVFLVFGSIDTSSGSL